MKRTTVTVLFPLATALFAALGTARAEFVLFENFDGLTNGLLTGQAGWFSTGGQVVADPENPLNKVAGFLGGSGDRGTYKRLSIPDGTTATLFFRYRVGSDNADTSTPVLNWSIGMSDTSLTGNAAFADYESQLNQNRDSGNNAPRQVRIRDAGAFDTLEDLNPANWYYTWMVIDNANDTTSVYMQGGQLPNQTLLDDPTGQTSFKFRNSGSSTVASNLIYFFIRFSSTQAGDLYLDDVYLDASGQNLAWPSPFDPGAPIAFSIQPTNITYMEGSGALSIVAGVTGGPPRYLQWERSDGLGGFTNIPSANSAVLVLGTPTANDSGAVFRLMASNAVSQAYSDLATLTVISDMAPPTVVSVSGKHTMTNIIVTFSEPVDAATGTDKFNYNITGGALPTVESIQLMGDGRIALLTTTTFDQNTDYTVTVSGVKDRAAAGNEIAENNSGTFRSYVLSPGFLTAELFLGISGSAIANLTGNAKYPNQADTNFYVAGGQTPSGLAENYGGHLVGYVIPPVDGLYTFYIRGDDGTELRLGSSSDPATLTRLSGVTSANQPFTSGASAPLNLVGGQLYALEALWKEGTGGDYVQVGWMPPWDTNIVIIPPTYVATYADPVGASVSITNQPLGGTVPEYREFTMSVQASRTPVAYPIAYQWQREDGQGGFTNIIGANNASFTTPLLLNPEDDGARYRVQVSVPGTAPVFSEPASVTVLPDTTPPTLLSARRGCPTTQVVLTFDERIPEQVIADMANYAIYDVGTSAAVGIDALTYMPDLRTVILQVSPALEDGHRYLVTIPAIIDLAGNDGATEIQITMTGTAAPQGANNLVAIEAENAAGFTPRIWNGVMRSWQFVTNRAGYSGSGAMQVLPNLDGGAPTGNQGPSLDFCVNFPAPGDYYLWVRAAGQGGNDDSAHAGLDGVVQTNADQIAGFNLPSGGYNWTGTSLETGNPRIVLSVPDAGIHTVNIFMREDGAYVDKIVLTTDSTYNPGSVNNGLGPDETPRTNPYPEQRVSIARATQGITVSWTGTGTLEYAGQITGPWTPLTGQSSPYETPTSGTMRFFRLAQ